jgi:hypothetical protein
MDDPPPYDGPWPNEKQPITEKANAAALLPPHPSLKKPIAIKAVCIFHLTQPAHTDSSGIKHASKIIKIKRVILEFDSNTTLAQFFELARATFQKLFHCCACCAPRKTLSYSSTVHPAYKQAAWEELKQNAAKLTNSRPKRFVTWTPATWEAEIQGAIASATNSKGKAVPFLELTSWFFQKKPRRLTPEEVRKVSFLARLACLAKGHVLR